MTQSALTSSTGTGGGVSVGPRASRGYKTFTWLNGSFLVVLCGFMLYPFVTVLAQSFSSAGAVRAGLVNVWPVGFNLDTYKVVWNNDLFWSSYRNTVVYTVVGTTIAMVLTTLFAFVLAKHHLRGRKVLIGIAVFTMFFNGGLIPNYVLVNELGLRNTVWAIALPNAISVFNLLVMKSFFENFSTELEEAAEIDGLSTYGKLWRIVLPLSKAVIATMVLFYAVAFWNSWFAAFLYMDHRDLYPVTVYLRNLIAGATSVDGAAGSAEATQIAANVKAVTMLLTVLPIVCLYPFVQRYFVSGVMLGSVKQ